MATVVVVRVALSLLSPRRTMRATLRLQRWYGRPGRSSSLSDERIAWAVTVASRRVPRATCLTQALATQALLARLGRTSALRIGVGRDEQGKVCAHAWVEVSGRAIIGGGGLERYTRMPDLDAVAGG